jgi:hypothetical protein
MLNQAILIANPKPIESIMMDSLCSNQSKTVEVENLRDHEVI